MSSPFFLGPTVFLHFPNGMWSTNKDFQCVLKGSYKEPLFSQEATWRRQERFHLKKEIFTVRTLIHWKKPPQGLDRVARCFEDVIEQGAR